MTIPSESPTRTRSVPAASTSAAKLASYAVRQAIGSPSAFIVRKVETLTGGSGMPRCSSWVYMRVNLSGQCRRYWIEEVAPARCAFDLLEKLFEVRIIIDWINLRRINNQERALIVGVEEPCVSVSQSLEIGPVHITIVTRVAPDKPLH